MSRGRLHTLSMLAVVGIAVLITGIGGLFTYMSLTARPIHPDARAVPASGTEPTDGWADAIAEARDAARRELVEQNLPGLSVAAGVDGRLVWAEGFGWADLERRARVEPDTRFRIGTASIAITSAAAGLLHERGQLDLDAPIQRYVPAYPEKPWPVTLRAVMAHLGGVPRDAGDEEPVRERCDETAGALRRFADRDLVSEPGARFHFSAWNWVLVSAAIEQAAGQPFPTFVRRQVLEPLGMHDTRLEAAEDPSPNQAIYYFPRFAADPRYGPQDPTPDDFSCWSGAAALVSTPSDLVRFGMAMARGTLLTPDTVRLLQAPQRTRAGDDTGYGLGWDRETLDGMPGMSGTSILGHDGDLRGGRVSSLWIYPNGLVVAVTSNIAFADTAAVATSVATIFAAAAAERTSR